MQNNKSIVYLIPSVIHETATETIPAYVLNAVKDCQVFFVENERSARRYLKSIWKEMVIDDYHWVTIHKAEEQVRKEFRDHIKQSKNIGIISEAGCPGVADPGQILVDTAHRAGALVKPLVGPSSILLALMASGLNGQQFMFKGYLPIDHTQRLKSIRSLEEYSMHNHCTMIFIETPYRNNQFLETLVKNCKPSTKLCIAVNITAPNESIHTKTILEWKQSLPVLPKEPAIFCLGN